MQHHLAAAQPEGSLPPNTAESLRLNDVPQTTLYRQVRALYRGGVLAIASSRRVRGTQEHTYVLAAGAALLRPADLAAATREDHLRYFNAFLAGLTAQFARYLQRPAIDLRSDGAGYRSVVLNLSDEEVIAMSRDVGMALRPYVQHEAGPERTPRLFSTVLIPLDDARGRD